MKQLWCAQAANVVNQLLTISIKVNIGPSCRIAVETKGLEENEKDKGWPGLLELAHGFRLFDRGRQRLKAVSGSTSNHEFNALRALAARRALLF
jgi:hypothetical protein